MLSCSTFHTSQHFIYLFPNPIMLKTILLPEYFYILFFSKGQGSKKSICSKKVFKHIYFTFSIENVYKINITQKKKKKKEKVKPKQRIEKGVSFSLFLFYLSIFIYILHHPYLSFSIT